MQKRHGIGSRTCGKLKEEVNRSAPIKAQITQSGAANPRGASIVIGARALTIRVMIIVTIRIMLKDGRL